MKLKVGQELWWVPARAYGSQCMVEVYKVGRKWALLSNKHRINVDTLIAENDVHTYPDRCFLSKNDYDNNGFRVAAWVTVLSTLLSLKHQYRMPEGVTLADIAQARKLLRL